ncbi:hypothetical protein Leryth_004452 [Lithospermum erythrorhizon]|nr:hypothetical protein Leryth_004452 [Lithospermum erythrorhizon]
MSSGMALLKLFVITFILYFCTLSTIVSSTSGGFNSNEKINQELLNQSAMDIEINDYSPPRSNPGHDPVPPSAESSVLNKIPASNHEDKTVRTTPATPA